MKSSKNKVWYDLMGDGETYKTPSKYCAVCSKT